MTNTSTAEALRGPWLAVLSDSSGFVFPNVADAIESLGEEEEVEIAVVRGTAMPNDRNGTTGVLLRRPGSANCGDVAYEIECYLVDPDDESVGAAARWAQAQAMAAGLNAAAEQPHPMPGFPCGNEKCPCQAQAAAAIDAANEAVGA